VQTNLHAHISNIFGKFFQPSYDKALFSSFLKFTLHNLIAPHMPPMRSSTTKGGLCLADGKNEPLGAEEAEVSDVEARPPALSASGLPMTPFEVKLAFS